MSRNMMTRRFALVSVLLAAIAAPALADDAEPQALSDDQVAQVVKDHIQDINECWDQLPAKDRKDGANVTIGLSIAPKGQVVESTIISDAPAETRACIAIVADHMVFPTVQLASDVEFPITLRRAH